MYEASIWRTGTLRRLLSRVPPPIVLEASTPVATVARALADAPGSIAVLVDANFVVRGTLTAWDLHHADAGVAAETIAVPTPMLEPECDLEVAEHTLKVAGVDRLLVVTLRGKLLGVLARTDFGRPPAFARA